MSLISLRGLSVRYGAVTVLHDVTMEIAPGEIVTVVGPNGSGKTSLLRAIIGAVAPAKGRVVHKPGLRIGYVPQRLHIDPTLPMTVERFLRLPGGTPKGACAEALETAGVPDLARRDWAMIRDAAHAFALITHYIRPQAIAAELADAGFAAPRLFAGYEDRELTLARDDLATHNWVYVLTRAA